MSGRSSVKEPCYERTGSPIRLRSNQRRALKELGAERPCAQSPPVAEEPVTGEGVQDYEHVFLMLLVVMLISALCMPCLLESTGVPPPPPPMGPSPPPSFVGRWLMQLLGQL